MAQGALWDGAQVGSRARSGAVRREPWTRPGTVARSELEEAPSSPGTGTGTGAGAGAGTGTGTLPFRQT